MGALWAEALPDTLFVALNAPSAFPGGSSGKRWFKAPPNSHVELVKEIRLLNRDLSCYFDNLLQHYGLPPEKLALVGFSQGARVALHVGLRRSRCAGVVAFAGAFLDIPTDSTLCPIPTLLIHGVEDKRVSSSLGKEAYKRLDALHVPVTLFLMPGVEHDIDPQGAVIASEFLKECFAGKMKNERVR